MVFYTGRSTGMGAYTKVFPFEGDVDVKEFNFSKTGNHWNILVEGTGVIDVVDISNSGKHRCKRVRLENDKVVETILAPEWTWWDEKCPICED